MTTRLATRSDFDTLYLLWEKAGLQLYPRADELQRYESMLALNPDLCLVLLNGSSDIVGGIFGAFDGRTASIHRLAILPEVQKQGWGQFLLQKLEKTLREKGIKKVSAQVHISNTQVLPFYEKVGFQEMTYVRTLYKDL